MFSAMSDFPQVSPNRQKSPDRSTTARLQLPGVVHPKRGLSFQSIKEKDLVKSITLIMPSGNEQVADS